MLTMSLLMACSGIGAAIANQLAKRGANVVVNYMTAGSRQRSDDLVKTINGYGVKAVAVKAVAVQADISKVSEIPKLVKAALDLSTTGKIEILVHK